MQGREVIEGDSLIVKELYKCYANYCRLAGARPKELLTGTTAAKTLVMHKHMTTMIKSVRRSAEVNIETDKDHNYHFVAWEHLNQQMSIYAIPMKLIEVLRLHHPELAVAAEKLYKLLMEIGFSHVHNNGRMEWLSEMQADRANEIADEDIEMAKRMLEEAAIYGPEGKAQMMIRDIYNHGKLNVKRVLAGVKGIKAKGRQFNGIKSLIIKGLEIIDDPRQRFLLNMDYPAYGNREDEDSNPIGIDEQFLVCWDDDDTMMAAYIETLNMDEQEIGATPLTCYSEITSRNRKLFSPNDALWFEDFNRWFTLMIRFTEEFIKEFKPKEDERIDNTDDE